MKKQFVKTSNYEKFQAAIRFVEARGALEASWLLVEGSPGFGKTDTVEEWATKNGAAYIRAKEKYSPSFFLEELADKLKVEGSGTRRERFQRITGKLLATGMPIVLDEVQHCLPNNASVLEALRDITDITETVAVLVAGEDKVQRRVARFPQLSRRIRDTVEFTPATAEDALLICRELAEVEIDVALVAEIHRQSKGLVSAIVNAIAAVEHQARRNRAKTVTLDDMRGQELVHDWQAARPQIVKAGGGEMATKTIQGFAIVGPAFAGQAIEVKGIGQDRVEAWKDCAQAHFGGNLDAAETMARNPRWKCVPADITVRFVRPEGI